MKKIILFMFLLNTILLNAQINNFKNLDSENIKFSKSELLKKENFFSHHSVSLGGGLTWGVGSGAPVLDYMLSTSVHFSKLYHIEIEYTQRKKKEEHIESYALLLLSEFRFNMDSDRWKLYLGAGLIGASDHKYGIIFPTANLKIEYDINRWFSVNTETIVLPIMQKLNLSFNLPY